VSRGGEAGIAASARGRSVRRAKPCRSLRGAAPAARPEIHDPETTASFLADPRARARQAPGVMSMAPYRDLILLHFS
jgi:hypothetical protein